MSIISPATYRAYVRTPYWQDMRAKTLRRAGGICEMPRCHARAVEVHHKTYHRCPWRERLDDLIAVCRKHHTTMETIRRQESSAYRRGKRVAGDFCGMARRLEHPQQMELPLT
jgi:hypothetical protein